MSNFDWNQRNIKERSTVDRPRTAEGSADLIDQS